MKQRYWNHSFLLILDFSEMSKTKRTLSTKNDYPSLEEQYKYIMKNFDFDQVLEYMKWDKSRREYDDDGNCIRKSDWKVFIKPGEFRVPTIDELSEQASGLLKRVIKIYNNRKSPYIAIATGPFKALCRYGILELNSHVETWSYD